MFGSQGLTRIIIMQVIGLVQVTLQGLAFKNDISFFQGKTDFSGLSSRTMQSQFLITLIIFLYLLDNEFTSRLVLYPMGIEVLISLWKLKRRMHLGFQWMYLLPWLSWQSSSSQTEGSNAIFVLSSTQS